jgi:hypothetical protein
VRNDDQLKSDDDPVARGFENSRVQWFERHTEWPMAVLAVLFLGA